MKLELEATILDLMSSQNDMTIATVRPDGYPQATTVSYASGRLIANSRNQM